MAKGAFTASERAIWDSIYGPSRGPSSGRLRILVEEFTRRGLVPAMMRIKNLMFPYDATIFQERIREAFRAKDENLVQVYYHPAECVAEVGSTTSTWTQWGRLILEVEGLVPRDADDTHPVLRENVPRIQIPVEVRDAIQGRGIRIASVGSLLSARLVAFFIAAQYEAWATPAQVARVSSYKECLRKLDYKVRDVLVRKGDGVDEVDAIIRDFEAWDGSPTGESEVDAIIRGIETAEAAPSKGAEVPPAEEVLKGSPPFKLHVEETENTEAVVNEQSSTVATVAAVALIDAEIEEIGAEIKAAEERLKTLRAAREEAQLEEARAAYLVASIAEVRVDRGGALIGLTLRFGEARERSYLVREIDA